MKTKILFPILLSILSSGVSAQNADTFVAAGRFHLAARDMTNANVSFAAAVAAAPNHETANALYAATRLLALPAQPAVNAFLDRLGVSRERRDLYHWSTSLPRDTNGVPLAPAGVNANEFAALLRTTVLPEISGAAANLAKVINTSFLLNLSSNETTFASVTVDYGDVQLLRAMLHAAEYYGYTIHSWNFDAQLSALRALATNRATTVQQVLAEYPQLFTFATTNDLAAAKEAFQKAVDRYFEASTFIRSRPTNITRLFNYDPDMAQDELKFRQTLADLKNSLNGPVVLTNEPIYTVHLARHFDGSGSLRSFFPRFYGNAFILGTFRDATFGGVIAGLQEAEVEKFLRNEPHFDAVPSFGQAGLQLNGQLLLTLHTLPEWGYFFESSTDLKNWTVLNGEVATTNLLAFSVDLTLEGPRRFYRVRQASNDDFADRFTIRGGFTTVRGSNDDAGREMGEPFHAGFFSTRSVWWSWTSPITGAVRMSAADTRFYPIIAVYLGTSLASLTPVASAQGYELTFNVVSGKTYQIAVDSRFGSFGSDITLKIEQSSAGGDLAPASIAGKIIRVTVAGDASFPITFAGTQYYIPPGGGEPDESGTFTYTKTGPGNATLVLSPSGDARRTTVLLSFTTSAGGAFSYTSTGGGDPDDSGSGTFTME
ncbi:MAG: hypothetical protein HY674_17210 [Chloroflexi bacterium]|nr:hypothetical protein [Chloroflexota bacterium]